MDDSRLWSFEQSLWIEGLDNYPEKVDPEVVMCGPLADRASAYDKADSSPAPCTSAVELMPCPVS